MYPFASHYGYKAIGALSTGSGSNGLVTSITALIQQSGPNGTALFGILPFFMILEGFIGLGTLAFMVLLLYPKTQDTLLAHAAPEVHHNQHDDPDDHAIHPILHGDPLSSTSVSLQHEDLSTLGVAKKIRLVLIHKVWIAFLNFTLVGILPYTVAGYGETVSKNMLFWAVISGVAVGAIGRLVTLAFQWHALNIQTLLHVRYTY
jgi:hypothetical protein